MIDTKIEIYSSNSQTVNLYDSDTGNTISTPTLTLGYRERNTSTSLVLHGDSAINYGQDLLTNLVHLAENFCNTTEPANPVLGQKFYNSDTQTLSIFDETWNEIVVTENTDQLDIVFESEKTSNHSDFILTDFLDKLIPLTGNLTPVRITLPGVDPVDDNEAVTKRYVDSVLTVPSPYVPRTGYAEMQGPLVVADTLRTGNNNAIVNIKYVNELGVVDTISNNATPAQSRTTTYRDVNRKNDDGTADTTPWFTTSWIHGTIADGSAEVTIELPIAFLTATSTVANYTYSAIAVCTSVDSNVKLNVTFVDGSHIKVKRNGTTGEVKFCGNVYGYSASS